MKLIKICLAALVSANQNDPTAILDQLRDVCVAIINSNGFGADAEWVSKWETKDWVELCTTKSACQTINSDKTLFLSPIQPRKVCNTAQATSQRVQQISKKGCVWLLWSDGGFL